MSITINPGTGPVAGTLDQARTNMDTFAADVAAQHGYDLDAAHITYVPVEPEPFRYGQAEHVIDPESDGRFAYRMSFGEGLSFDIEMPGVPVEQVRFTGAEDQNIWDYPRLYVDGSSWVWKYAVKVCRPEADEQAV